MKLAFVPPWYGDQIAGGAETACRDLAKLLRESGFDVEVLTTCVRDFRSDWNVNHHVAGLSEEGGLPVRRFPVRVRDVESFDAINRKLLQGAPIARIEEDCFFREMIHSPALYDYIGQNAADYIFFFVPYMFGTTVMGSMICPGRSILIPCLHDESYARLTPVVHMFRQVKRVIFLTHEERKLAETLYGVSWHESVLGAPINTSWSSRPECFRKKYGIDNFLLYAGRTDYGKKADVLIEYFDRFKREVPGSLNLVFIGSNSDISAGDKQYVHSLGFLSEQDKYDCYGASLALCIPSVMESFSIVMMESWLAKRPVIVNNECAVTSSLCTQSNGGLSFNNYDEFREIVLLFQERKDIADQLGRQGRNFVIDNYSPGKVAERYDRFISAL
jgi:glycosyltransferase involved in cell wall biosynthesis